MRRASRGPGRAIFAATFVLYLAVGVYLAAGLHVYVGDSLSRVQSAQSVLFSRDPHLAAIGFIFTPLTAIVQLPLTALTPWWPELTTEAISAAVMSAAFMAGSVVQISGVARDRGLPGWMGGLITVCYAINPMIVFYGANGMSEAPYLFFLAWASRRLIRWVDTDDVHELVVAAMALGFGYLTRYDGGAATMAAALLVGLVSFRRAEKVGTPPSTRWYRTILDVGLVVLPSAVAFVGWALTSWLITGNAFAQFSSEYGNASIIEQSGGSGSDTTEAALRFSMTELAILAPLFPLLLVAVVVTRATRRRLYPLLPTVLLIGAVLAFQILSYSRGSTFGFLRFYITVIALAAIVALLAVPARRTAPVRRPGVYAAMPVVESRRRPVTIMGIAAVVTMLVAIPVTAWGMTSPKYAPQEFALTAVVAPRPDSSERKHLDAQRVLRSFSTERALAQYLDSLDLPEGSVLCDTVYGFAVVVASTRPKQFVIPSDQDFTTILNDPAANGVQYLLSVPNEGRGSADALNIRYPTLYDNGSQISVLVLEARNDGANLPDWRIYRVIPR
uniref:ArnT family glycosyltransferase n=1 Tax=Gordonia sp. B7-2 TaxID=3420932 RepID=UPI003D93F5E9